MRHYIPPKRVARHLGIAPGTAIAVRIIRASDGKGGIWRYAVLAPFHSRSAGVDFGRGWKLAKRGGR